MARQKVGAARTPRKKPQPAPKAGRRWILALVIALAAIAAGFFWQTQWQPIKPSVPTAGKWTELAGTFTLESSGQRVVAIGDIHANYINLLRTLELAGLVAVAWAATPQETALRAREGRGKVGTVHPQPHTARNWTWTGGRAWLVQLGDVVDRGHDTALLYATIEELRAAAAAAGGRVYSVLGNHEVMNMMGDLRFVTAGDTAAFGGVKAREAAWSSAGALGRAVREWNVTLVLADTVFVHGGLSTAFFGGRTPRLTPAAANEAARRLFAARPSEGPGLYEPGHPLVDADGPMWYRGQAQLADAAMCAELQPILTRLNLTRLVVGHTPQMTGRILHRVCPPAAPGAPPVEVFGIDVGIAPFYGGNAGALELVYRPLAGAVVASAGQLSLGSTREDRVSGNPLREPLGAQSYSLV